MISNASYASTSSTGGCGGRSCQGAQEPLQPYLDSGREEQPARILQGNGNSGSVIAVSSNVSTPFSDSSDISRSDHLPTEGDSGRGGGGYGGRSDMSAVLPLTNRLAHGGLSRRGADIHLNLHPAATQVVAKISVLIHQMGTCG